MLQLKQKASLTHSTAWHSTVQHSVAQLGTARYSTAQHTLNCHWQSRYIRFLQTDTTQRMFIKKLMEQIVILYRVHMRWNWRPRMLATGAAWQESGEGIVDIPLVPSRQDVAELLYHHCALWMTANHVNRHSCLLTSSVDM